MRLDHPLLGFDRRYTAVALGYVGIAVAGTILFDLFSRGLIDVVPAGLSLPIEVFIAVLILVFALSAAVVPTLYALVNGGPVVAAAISLVPNITIVAVTGQWMMTNDFLVALIGAAIGASVAVAHQLYRERGRQLPPESLVDGLLIATMVTVVAVVGAVRFTGTAPLPFVVPIRHWLWASLLPISLCLACWLLVFRSWSAREVVDPA